MRKKPNILFITSDQHRGDTLGCAGHPCVRTPHLDALSCAGMMFTNAYTNCPVCIPARTSIITGRNAHANGSPDQNKGYVINRNKETYLGSLMTRAGYQTQLIGKTHWHVEKTFRAGFENIITYDIHDRDRLVKSGRKTRLTGLGAEEMNTSISQFPPELNSTQWAIDKCIDFIDYRDRTAPFFLWVSLKEPHPPNIIHEPYYSMYDHDNIPDPALPQWAEDDRLPYAMYLHKHMHTTGTMTGNELRKIRSVYYGMVTHLDHQLGRLFGKIIMQGIWDDTIVIYSTDHGEKLGDYGDFGKRCFTENAANIPFIVKWPSWVNAEPGRISNAFIELSDILPTLCDFAEVQAPADITGKSIRGIIEGTCESIHEELHGQFQDSHMYIRGKYKYLYFAEDGKELLFDFMEDTLDERDLSENSDLLEQMRNWFVQHLESEGHEHIIEGKLLNRGLNKPAKSRLREKVIAMCKTAAI